MTSSVNEYHFFFLTQEAEALLPSPPSEQQPPDDMLRSLLHYFEKGRLQTFTLYLRGQFPSARTSLACHELTLGSLPDRPTSWSQIRNLPSQLLNLVRPAWRLKNRWDSFQGCSVVRGSKGATKLFVRTGTQADGTEGVLIHGELSDLPLAAVADTMAGRRLLSLTGGLLPGDHTHSAVTLLSGSSVHIELLDLPEGGAGLRPLVVVRATTSDAEGPARAPVRDRSARDGNQPD